jgi:hypothetical protein
MNQRIQFILGFAFLISALPALGANSYRYRVHMPKSDLSCEKEAQLLGDRFKAATGLAVTEQKCVGTVTLNADGKAYTLYTLSITYTGDAPVYPYTAYFGESATYDTPSNLVGTYSLFSDCLADLPGQLKQFEAQTGLIAVSAGCEPGQMDIESNYVLKIEGFGDPKNRLFVLDPKRNVQATPEWNDKLASIIPLKGGTIVKRNKEMVYYYASSVLPAREVSLAFFNKKEECLAQLDQAQKIFKNVGADVVYADCLAPARVDGPSPGARLEVIHDSYVMVGGDSGLRDSAIDYYSFAECMADRDAVLADLLAKHSRVLGGICHPKDLTNIYILEGFEQY